MQIGELLDQLAHDSGDPSGDFRTAALRWLNLTRSEISARRRWKTALDPNAQIVTNPQTTTGIYPITGYEFVASIHMTNVTSSRLLRYCDLEVLQVNDPDKDDTGDPDFWADAGMSSDGVRQVLLWQRPSAEFTIEFIGYRSLTDITSSALTAEVDAFFGPVLRWSNCFVAGMRKYHAWNDDQGRGSEAEMVFEKYYKQMAAADMAAVVPVHSIAPIFPFRSSQATARFNPSHYGNR